MTIDKMISALCDRFSLENDDVIAFCLLAESPASYDELSAEFNRLMAKEISPEF